MYSTTTGTSTVLAATRRFANVLGVHHFYVPGVRTNFSVRTQDAATGEEAQGTYLIFIIVPPVPVPVEGRGYGTTVKCHIPTTIGTG